MYLNINRNIGIFSPTQSDEINAAFQSIDKAIDDYKAEPLEYKESVQMLTNRTFKAGNVLYLREEYEIKNDLDEFTKIAELPNISIPFDVWVKANTKENEQVLLHILEKNVYAYGHLSSYPKTVYCNIDITLPSY